MGNILYTNERCFRENCNGNVITYKMVYEFPQYLSYKQLMTIVNASPIKKFHKECYHFTSLAHSKSYISFDACDNCIDKNLIEHFIYNKDGYSRYKF